MIKCEFCSWIFNWSFSAQQKKRSVGTLYSASIKRNLLWNIYFETKEYINCVDDARL